MSHVSRSPADLGPEPHVDHASHDRRINRRGSLVNYLTGALQGAVFLFHILAARLFGAAAYGAYRWAWSVIEIALQIGLWGTNQAVLKGVAAAEARQDLDERRSVIATSMGTVTWWSTAAAAVLVLAPATATLFSAQLPPEGALGLRLLAPVIPLWNIMMVLVSATMATRSMGSNFAVRGVTYPIAINVALLVFAAIWPHNAGVGVGGIALAQVCATASALIVAVVAYRRLFGERPPLALLPTAWDRRVLAFAAPVGAAEVVNQTLSRIDIVLLGLLRRDPQELAAYGAAMLLAEAISGPRYALDPLLSAVVAATHATGDRERLARNLREMVVWVARLAFPIGIALMVWGDSLLRLWGTEYTLGFAALIVLAAAHLLNGNLGLHQWVVVMSGHPTLDLINNLCALCTASAVCFVAIPRVGMAGAAVGALTAVVTLRGLQLLESRRLAGAHGLSAAWLRVAAAGACSALLQVAMRVFVGHEIVHAVVGLAVGIGVYVVTVRQWSRG